MQIKTIEFRFPDRIIPRERPRQGWVKKKRWMQGAYRKVFYTPARTLDCQNQIAWFAQAWINEQGQQAIFPIKETDCETIALGGVWYSRGDLNNVMGTIMDALQDVIYENDRQVNATLPTKLIRHAKGDSIIRLEIS